MEQVENFLRLEEAIDKLLRSQEELRQENVRLQTQLAQRDREAAELRQQLDEVQGERGKIHQRVAGLIDTIEKWEKMTGNRGTAEVAGAKSAEGKTLF